MTQVGVMGPNVVLNFKSIICGIAPHQRWAAGLLVDSSEFTGGTDLLIAFSNRDMRAPVTGGVSAGPWRGT